MKMNMAKLVGKCCPQPILPAFVFRQLFGDGYLGALIGEELGHSLDVITERREVGIRIKHGISLLDQHVKIFGKGARRQAETPPIVLFRFLKPALDGRCARNCAVRV